MEIETDILNSCNFLADIINGNKSATNLSDIDSIPMYIWAEGIVLLAKCYSEIENKKYMEYVQNPFHVSENKVNDEHRF